LDARPLLDVGSLGYRITAGFNSLRGYRQECLCYWFARRMGIISLGYAQIPSAILTRDCVGTMRASLNPDAS
jgi:hypothetical protein